MKKLLLSFLFLVLLVGCSEEENSNATLFVDGQEFIIGLNAPGNQFNTTTFINDSELKLRTFIIVKSNFTSQIDAEIITLIIGYPSSQTSINGTYSFTEETNLDGIPFGVCELSNSNDGFGGEPSLTSGSVTVTDLGFNKYKLEFSNVTVTNNSNVTRTITGYCAPIFANL